VGPKFLARVKNKPKKRDGVAACGNSTEAQRTAKTEKKEKFKEKENRRLL